MDSAISSMFASSKAATSSVLNARVLSDSLMLEALLRLGQLVDALGQRVAGAKDPGTVLHGRLHRLPYVGDSLGLPGRPSIRLIRRTSSSFWRITTAGGGLAVAAYSAAALPARAPKTRHSGSELEPSRFAPLMLTQAVSPAANSPSIGVAPLMSVATPPIM